MIVFVDTGAWFASVVPTDPDHTSAQAWLAQNRHPLLTSDYVVDETLTLLRRRGQSHMAFSLGQSLFSQALATIHYLTQAEIQDAWSMFQQFDDKDWSFTDCTSKVVMTKLGITEAFSFDRHFRQFGTVTVVP